MTTTSIKQTILARTARTLTGARRVAAMLLAMILTMTAQTAWAQGPWTSGGCDVTLVGGTLTVSKSASGDGAMADDGSDWYDYREDITSIVIENGVTHIGNFAFDGCNNASLTTVALPASVTSIGEYAFHSCSSMTSIIIPASVTTIGNNAFDSCEKLGVIVVQRYNSEEPPITTLGDDAFVDCDAISMICVPDNDALEAYKIAENWSSQIDKIQVINENNYCGDPDVNGGKDVNYSYSYCSDISEGVLVIVGSGSMNNNPWKSDSFFDDITTVNIGYGVTSICDQAFADCLNLKSVNIPATVTTIGKDAFNGCSSLTSVTIPSSVTTIGEDAFYGCSSLESITIPASVTTIYGNTFNGCGNLERINVDGNNMTYTSEDGVLFNKAKTTLVRYPRGKSETSYTIPASVTTIGDHAFEGCENLATVTLEEGSQLQTIGEMAFNSCSSLESFTIPASVTSIGSNAFEGCENLQTVTFEAGSQLQTIGEMAFNSCSRLESFTIPASVTSIGNGAFSDTGWYNKQSEGLLYLGDWLLGYKGNEPTGTLQINEGTKRIAAGAFHRCNGLTAITFPASVTSIGVSAFYWCDGLTSITIPASVTSIGTWAFASCSNLATVYVLRSESTITTLGDNVFSYCDENLTIVVPSAKVTNYKEDNKWSTYGSSIVAGYTITCSEGISCTTTNNGPLVQESETVTLNYNNGAALPEGKVLKATDDLDNEVAVTQNDNTFSFTMPAGDVTVSLKKNFTLCTATVPNQMSDNSYTRIFYKFESANNPLNGVIIGETVTDGNQTLVLGTDYEFGSVSYTDGRDYWIDADKDVPDDECQVEIRGKGEYAGTKKVTFEIISPSGSGTWGDLSWSVENGTLSISGTGSMNAAATDGYPWYDYRSIITTVNIGEGVTSVADKAFGAAQNNSIYTYNNVAKVTIPTSVTSIGADAFKGCISTTDVYCYANPSKLTWGDTGDDFILDNTNPKQTKCHVADATAWSKFSGVNVTFEGDLAAVSIPYIDADGNTAYCTDFDVLTGNDSLLDAGWYVMNSNVSCNKGLISYGDIHLILADNATLTINTDNKKPLQIFHNLTIYAQSTGESKGSLIATNNSGIAIESRCGITICGGKISATGSISDGTGIFAGDGITISGGDISATGGYYGINGSGSVTISGGKVSATGSISDGTGIYASGGITITGGTATATGNTGFFAENDNITLSGATIEASNYSTYRGTVSIANGKAMTDGTNTYLGTLTDVEIAAIAGKTLQPITGVTLTKDGSGKLTASLDPTSEDEVSIPVAVEVDHVEVERNYEANKASTVYLPFTIALGNVSGGTFNKFTGVDETTTPLWTVKYEEVTASVDDGKILANTPYIFLPAGGKITVNNTEKVTVGTEIASTPQTASGWEFIGTHKRIKWTHDTTDPEYTLERENEIGSIYGFAANDSGTDHVGDFVKVGNNVWINPERAYLKRTASSARAMKSGAQTQQLPDKMKVVIVSADGTTTEIGTLDTRTGEISLDEWYSLDGSRLSGKPTKSGLYINNGKKVLVP